MKRVLITGAAKGIGKALAVHFSEKGFEVIATDLDEDGLQTIKKEHKNISTYSQEVRNYEAWLQLANELEESGRLPDILINNAGVIRPGLSYEQNAADIDLQLDVNTKGLIFGTNIIGAKMVVRGSGHIINIASLAGIAPIYGLSMYCASKFAARGFTLAAAQEFIEKGVYVTCICPDGTNTPMFESMASEPSLAMAFSAKKILEPADIVTAVEKALKCKSLEITLPLSRGIISKLASLNIRMGILLKNKLLKRGRSNQKVYAKKMKK
ncbi:SDR family oxidoreductase [Peijinzhouia sedimentorum]